MFRYTFDPVENELFLCKYRGIEALSAVGLAYAMRQVMCRIVFAFRVWWF